MYHFVNVLDAPSKENWKGAGGTISLIRKALHLDFDHHRKILFMLKEIIRCVRVGGNFDGTIKSHAGRKHMIKAGSVEEALIATWMELHCGFRMTTIMVNEHRREEGKDRVSRHAVISAFYRLQPKIIPIKKIQSGGNNKGWIDASYNICKQMKIMLGKEITADKIMTDKEGNDKTITYSQANLRLIINQSRFSPTSLVTHICHRKKALWTHPKMVCSPSSSKTR